MLRFEFTSSQRPRLRGKPFKLFSDELPVIDFEKQLLWQKLAEQSVSKSSDLFSKKKPLAHEQDSHSLPAIGGPDWDMLSSSDLHSVKSESRLRALKPDLLQIHKNIRERLGLKETNVENTPNYFQRSIHRSDHLKSMPKQDEYKKFIQWPTLPSQQIIDPIDIKQYLDHFKDGYEALTNSDDKKGKAQQSSSLSDNSDYPKHKLKLDHGKFDQLNIKPKTHKAKRRDTETQTPRKVPKSTQEMDNSLALGLDGKTIKLEENRNEAEQISKQTVSILKRYKDTGQISKPLGAVSVSQDVQSKPMIETSKFKTDTDAVNALVHCDIPRKLLTSKKPVFNTNVGDILSAEQKSSRKVNFKENTRTNKKDIVGNDVSEISETENNKNVSLLNSEQESEQMETSTKHDSLQPKLVSAYVLQKLDTEQTTRKHQLHDHTAKKRKLQNMLKHFRKIRGRHNVHSTINLNAKSKSLSKKQTNEGIKSDPVKDNDIGVLDSEEKPASNNTTPRSKIDISKHVSQHVSSRLDMSKSQSLNEDIETCVQLRKHHKILKRHKVSKQVRINEDDLHESDSDDIDKTDDLDSEIDRSLTGTELIKAYRFWNRRKQKYTGGLRTIKEPPTVTDYFSNMSHKKLNGFGRMSFKSETDEFLSESD